jgi:hypothetical protein
MGLLVDPSMAPWPRVQTTTLRANRARDSPNPEPFAEGKRDARSEDHYGHDEKAKQAEDCSGERRQADADKHVKGDA